MISEVHTHEDPILTREEAIEILNTPDDQLDALIERAGILRKKYKGNHVSIHILTNVRSGNCSQDCAYCAQSCRSNADIDTYKWVEDEKLYNDNDFVNEHHLSRHCIGLSGMGFTDARLMQDFSRFVPNVHFEQIPIKNLVSNQEYQRPLSQAQVEKAIEDFDLNQINPVKVSRRDCSILLLIVYSPFSLIFLVYLLKFHA